MKQRNHVLVAALAAIALSGCRAEITPSDLGQSEIESSLFLIGDAGEPDPRERSKVLDSLAAHVSKDPQKALVVFLGDNVYPDGIPEEGQAAYADARRGGFGAVWTLLRSTSGAAYRRIGPRP
jgi:hypothetical protein